jgi:glutamine amidotransferase
MTTLAVIDHGAGNLVSMEQALVRAGADEVRIVERATELTRIDGIVLPGVGATGPAMRTLRRRGFTDALGAFEGPLLGVCVGMQLLFDHSLEDATDCLGILGGFVRPIAASPLPHMGWNDVDLEHSWTPAPETPRVPGLSEGPFYFVHGFVPEPDDPSLVVGVTTYGTDRFSSVVRRGQTVGVQFHPERSDKAGIAVLSGFVEMCREVARAA